MSLFGCDAVGLTVSSGLQTGPEFTEASSQPQVMLEFGKRIRINVLKSTTVILLPFVDDEIKHDDSELLGINK